MKDRGRMGTVLNGMAGTSRRALGQDDSFVIDSAPLDFGNDVPMSDAPTSSPAIQSDPLADAVNAAASDYDVQDVTITSPDQVQELPLDTPPVIENPIFSAIDVNKLVKAGGVIYRYVRQETGGGSVKYIPQRVNVRQAGTKPSGALIALGIAAALFLLH